MTRIINRSIAPSRLKNRLLTPPPTIVMLPSDMGTSREAIPVNRKSTTMDVKIATKVTRSSWKILKFNPHYSFADAQKL
jgi:hypothetical protein